jgi:protein-L-isoaspartate(D-aspartate) O-methyltransferase
MPYVDLKIIAAVIFSLLLINTEMINAFEKMRENMVNVLIRQYRLTDERVLQSMRSVPRHLFVDKASERFAYDDNPLPIGHGQTISQPFIVALMTSVAQISPSDKVLEIGTGDFS